MQPGANLIALWVYQVKKLGVGDSGTDLKVMNQRKESSSALAITNLVKANSFLLSAAITLAAGCCTRPGSCAEGIDIIFSGDKLISAPDAEETKGKSLILQGEVSESGQLTVPRMAKPQPFNLKAGMLSPTRSLFADKPFMGGVSMFGPSDLRSGRPVTVKGAVSANVPKTADDVADYLRRMKELLANYQSSAISDIFHGGTTVNMKNVNVGQVQSETIDMIDQIRAVIPPAELRVQHEQLATALSSIRNLLAPSRENPLAELSRIAPAMKYLNRTMESYHQGVLAIIAQYQLPSSLDPIGNDNPATDRMLQNAYSSLSSQLISSQSASAGGENGQTAGLANLLSGSGAGLAGNAGGGDAASSLSGLLGSSGGMAGLSKLIGGSGGNLQGLSRLMGSVSTGGLQGGGALNAGPALGAPLNSLQSLMGGATGSEQPDSQSMDGQPSGMDASASDLSGN